MLKNPPAAPKLPTPSEDQMRAVSQLCSFQLYQFLRYLLHTKNGERTDYIRSICKIGNPSDINFKYQRQINKMGLSLECINVRNIVHIDGADRARIIGTWHLSIIDRKAWDSFGKLAKASNDPIS